MKIATWNVNGIRARHAQVHEWALRERPDVLCLQELKALPEQVPATVCDLEGYWCYWHGYKAYSGVSLQVRKDLAPDKPEFSHPPFDHESRIVTAKIGALTIASIYVPNGGKDYAAKLRFLEAMVDYAAAFRATGAPLVMCGDFNVARTEVDVHPTQRNPNQIGQRPEERALIERILAEGLVDVGRALDPDNDRLFTWWAPWRNMRQRNMGWRLDYVFASSSLAAKARACVSLREVGTSDHGPVVATFEAGGEPGRAHGAPLQG